MKYAVIKLAGHEYKVSEGDTIKVNRLKALDPKVLMFREESDVLVGNPYVEGVVVKAQLSGEEKGKKLTIRRFKHKSRYHKTKGYRSQLSVVKILSISKGDAPESNQVKPTEASAVEKPKVKKTVKK